MMRMLKLMSRYIGFYLMYIVVAKKVDFFLLLIYCATRALNEE